MKNLNFSVMLPIESSSQGLKGPRQALQGRVRVRLNRTIEALVQPLPVHLENLYLLSPAAFSKKLLSGSLIRSLLSADTSAVRKSSDGPDKAPPGPQCPVSSHYHSNCQPGALVSVALWSTLLAWGILTV